MSDLYLPQRAFFEFSFRCPRRQKPPKIDGNLRDWDDAERVPDLMAVDGHKPFAAVYMAYDDSGLYFACAVANKTTYQLNPLQPAAGDSLELFIDTRDVKEHRANRFCHRFYVLPGGSGKGGKQPIARQTAIEDAREQAPPCPEDAIETGLRRLKRSYQLEVKLPAAGLNGFAPREFSRVGFAYLLHDAQHGTQSWSSIPDLGVERDPSTWGTAELVG